MKKEKLDVVTRQRICFAMMAFKKDLKADLEAVIEAAQARHPSGITFGVSTAKACRKAVMMGETPREISSDEITAIADKGPRVDSHEFKRKYGVKLPGSRQANAVAARGGFKATSGGMSTAPVQLNPRVQEAVELLRESFGGEGLLSFSDGRAHIQTALLKAEIELRGRT